MSDIIRARAQLEEANKTAEILRKQIAAALSMMKREAPIKRAAPQFVEITPAIRALVNKLAAQGISNHDIAERVGLRNGGRVSEILTGKR